MKYKNLFNLKGKIAVVTGGAGLIGRELVRGLAECGASVILAEIDRNKGRSIAKEFLDLNLNVIFRFLDITSEKSVLDLISFIGRNFHRIDIWINSAYPKTKDWGKKFEDIPVSSWRKNVDMHLNGYFICCQKIAEYMKIKKRGSIINFASTYGIIGPDFSIYKGTGMTTSGAYSVIKGGIVNFTKYLASYYGDYNIRVNCVSPGGVYDKQPEKFVKKYAHKTLVGRMAQPDDIVGAVIYLASDAARYVTGHNLVVDGGFSII